MATTNVTGFRVGADVNPFEAAMRRMNDSARTTSSSINRVLGTLGTSLSVAAFTGWIKGAIDAADETAKLAQKTGLAVNQVAGLQLAFRQAGASQQFEMAMSKLGKAVVDGNKALVAMGIETKNADGSFKTSREVIGSVAERFATYRNGVEKTALAVELFGERAGPDLIPLLNGGADALDEYDATAQRLALTIDEKTATSAEHFNDTMDLIGQSSRGVATQMAAQLLPTLSGLADQFFSTTTKGDGLSRTATVLATAMKGLYITGIAVSEAFSTVGTVLGGVFAAVAAAVNGDFSGAMNIVKMTAGDITSNWKSALAGIDAAWNTTGSTAVENMAKMVAATKGAAPVSAKSGSTKKGKAARPEREASAMQAYDAALTQQKLAFEQQNTLLEFGKAQELAYWKDIIATYEVGSKDRSAIVGKMLKLELDILREGAKQKSQIDELRREDWKSETLDYVAELEARAAFDRDQGTLTQTEYLQRQQGFNQMKLQAEMEFLQQKLELAKLDPENNLVLMEQIELQKLELKRRFRAAGLEIDRQIIVEQQATAQTLSQSIAQSLGGLTLKLLTDWRNLGSALKSTLQGIGQSIIQEVVIKPLQAKIAAWVKEKMLTTASIGANAAKAGSGAASSQASIPYIGPILALAAMATVFAAVSGMSAKVPSASRGFDIPSGLNPLTQLHEQEMVLPAHIANPLRESLAEGGGGVAGGGGRQAEGQIRGMPPAEWLMVHRGDLVNALKGSQRDFAFTKF